MTVHRQWKLLGSLPAKTGWLVLSYAIPTLHGDMDTEGEDALFALALAKMADRGLGRHVVAMGSKRYCVMASGTDAPPQMGEHWRHWVQ